MAPWLYEDVLSLFFVVVRLAELVGLVELQDVFNGKEDIGLVSKT